MAAVQQGAAITNDSRRGPAKPRSLVMANSLELTHALLEVLAEAGFDIDCVSNRSRMRQLRHIERFHHEKNYDALIRRSLSLVRQHRYALVVAADDQVLKRIVDAALPAKEKLLLLPVSEPRDLAHLASKIGLSRALHHHGIPTPEFEVALDTAGIRAAAARIGFPLMVKGDFSGGGNQVFKCRDSDDLTRVMQRFRAFPALVQQFIEGELVGVEAFFRQGQLLHFAYSETLAFKSGHPYAPSSVRQFLRREHLPSSFAADLQALGRTLGADGFANITAIRTSNGRHCFFEADMRPTVWIGYGRLYGDSLANRLAEHFDTGVTPDSGTAMETDARTMEFCYPPRLALWKLLLNRHQAWTYCRKHPLMFRFVLRKLKQDVLGILNLRLLRHALRAG